MASSTDAAVALRPKDLLELVAIKSGQTIAEIGRQRSLKPASKSQR